MAENEVHCDTVDVWRRFLTDSKVAGFFSRSVIANFDCFRDSLKNSDIDIRALANFASRDSKRGCPRSRLNRLKSDGERLERELVIDEWQYDQYHSREWLVGITGWSLPINTVRISSGFYWDFRRMFCPVSVTPVDLNISMHCPVYFPTEK
jgi:hypothetical protein